MHHKPTHLRALAAACLLLAACGTEPTPGGADDTGSGGVSADTGTSDSAGAADGGTTDGGATDAGNTDAGTIDTGTTDAGPADAATSDAATPDAADAAQPDVGAQPDAACGSCDDGNPCTDDDCKAGACSHTPNSANCDDGDPCTAGDTCAGGSCTGAPTLGSWTIGGAGEDVGRAAVGLSDGGWIVAGHTDGGGVGGKAKGKRDVWLLRVSATGQVVWEQVLGNDLGQSAFDVAAAGGGFVAGGTWREHGDKQPRGWLHAFDDKGVATASHVFTTAEFTEVHGVAGATTQGKAWIAVGGYVEDAAGNIQLAVAKVAPGTLKPSWTTAVGKTGFDAAWDVAALANGHIGLVGDTAPGGSGPHLWLLEVDAKGATVWQRTYFSDGEDTGWALSPIADAAGKAAGYVVAGSRKPKGASVTDAWLMRADAAGKDLWQQSAKAPAGAAAYAIGPAPKGGYVVAGRQAKSAGNDKALLWQTDNQGATSWALEGGVSGAQGLGVATWPEAVGLVGRSASGKASQLLLMRASLSGKMSCK